MPIKDPEKRKEYNRKYNQKRYESKKEEILQQSRNYYQKHKKKVIARQKRNLQKPEVKKRRKDYITGYLKKHEAKYKRYHHNFHLKKKYGITIDEYETMIKAQDNKCALCGKPFEKDKTYRPDVDHNHSSKKIRAILHRRCNTMLGHAKDDIEIFKSAIAYLQKYN